METNINSWTLSRRNYEAKYRRENKEKIREIKRRCRQKKKEREQELKEKECPNCNRQLDVCNGNCIFDGLPNKGF